MFSFQPTNSTAYSRFRYNLPSQDGTRSFAAVFGRRMVNIVITNYRIVTYSIIPLNYSQTHTHWHYQTHPPSLWDFLKVTNNLAIHCRQHESVLFERLVSKDVYARTSFPCSQNIRNYMALELMAIPWPSNTIRTRVEGQYGCLMLVALYYETKEGSKHAIKHV
jgi:hypothetical protein